MDAWRVELNNSIVATLEDSDKEQKELVVVWLLHVVDGFHLEEEMTACNKSNMVG